MESSNTKPLVSILSITYNHSQYISQAIESFLMQKTSFEFEIVIADDNSTDNNQEIIKKYKEKFPDKINTILRKENIGANNNFNDAFNNCKGKYIAICEGDDYWTDPNKLQKQVDFLEANPDYGLVHTAYLKCNAKGEILNQNQTNNTPEGWVHEDILIKNFIGTLTSCFRKEYIITNAKVLNKYKMGDLPLWMNISLITKVGFIPDVTAVYRIIENSASHQKDKNKAFNFTKSAFDLKFDFIRQHDYSMEAIRKVNYNYSIFLLKYALILSRTDLIKELWHFKKRKKMKSKILITLLSIILYIKPIRILLKKIYKR